MAEQRSSTRWGPSPPGLTPSSRAKTSTSLSSWTRRRTSSGALRWRGSLASRSTTRTCPTWADWRGSGSWAGHGASRLSATCLHHSKITLPVFERREKTKLGTIFRNCDCTLSTRNKSLDPQIILLCIICEWKHWHRFHIISCIWIVILILFNFWYVILPFSSVIKLICLCKLYLRLCFLLKTLRQESATRVCF